MRIFPTLNTPQQRSSSRATDKRFDFEPLAPNITHVDFGTFAYRPEAFQKLLSKATNIKDFSTTIQALHNRSGIHFVDIMKGVKDTIEVLGLYETPWLQLARHALPINHGDFTAFKQQLRHLRITSALWYSESTRIPNTFETGFVWKQENRLAARVYSFLPSSLQELEIQFEFPSRIFARGWNYNQQFELAPVSLQIKGFG
jgi:hypothetical protein